MSATADAITVLGFTGFTVRINDRQILFGLAEACGFAPEDYGSVFITLDKLDKVGLDGVRAELESKGFAAEPIQRMMEALTGSPRIAATSPPRAPRCPAVPASR